MAPKRLFFVAGERSGDLQAARLIAALKGKEGEQLSIRAWGGEEMEAAGAQLLQHYRAISVLGFGEVLTKYRYLRKMISHCKADIEAFKPDILVLVDFGGWNLRLATWAKKRGIRVHYHIPPKTWAWGRKRLKKLVTTVELAYCVLPFEESYYCENGLQAHYVGNATVHKVKQHRAKAIPSDGRPIVALLPGSRAGELTRILPEMVAVAALLPQYRFVVAGVKTLDSNLYQAALDAGVEVLWERTYDLLAHSRAAVVASGTATLETALFRVPQVLVYRVNGLSYQLLKRLIKLKYIGLVNLILNKAVVPELLQKDCQAAKIAETLEAFLGEDNTENMQEDYKALAELMGDKQPGEIAAEHILAALSRL